MLILSRKLNERILIGDGIVIEVLQIRGASVRIGIEAPRNVLVIRDELAAVEQSVVAPTATENPDADWCKSLFGVIGSGGACLPVREKF